MKRFNCVKKYAAAPFAAGMALMSSVPVFAADSSAAVSASDWAPVISALTGQISVATIMTAMATFMLSAIGIVFMWWGVRKGVRTLMAAFRKGKISV